MKVIVRTIKVLLFIPAVLLQAFLIMVAVVVVTPLSYIIKGSDFEECKYFDMVSSFGKYLDNWWRED